MRKSLFVALGASAVLMVPTRLLTASQYLHSWDSVNFALGMDELDIGLHRPHPPGYVGLVLAARFIRLFGPDANLSMVLWNTLLAVAACVVLYAFAYEIAPRHRRRCAWIAWAIIAPSPLFWFYTSVAEIYVSEMFFTLLVAYFAFRTLRGEQAYLYPLAGALALTGAFKLSAMLLMMPLAGYTLLRAPVRRKRRSVGVFVGGLGIWLLPLLWSQGPAAYVSLFWSQFTLSSAPTSPLVSGDLELLNRNARDTLQALLVGLGLVNLLFAAGIIAARASRSVERNRGRDVLLLWGLPYGFVFVFVHFAKFGYALPLVPVACLALASLFGQLRYRKTVSAVLAAHWILGTAFFVVARPASGGLIGEGLRYADKSISQKTLTEFNALLRPTLGAIRSADADVEWTRRQIGALCADEEGVVIVADGEMLNWRRAMYYFPQARSVRFAGEGGSVLLAHQRREEIPGAGDVVLSAPCRAFWMVPRSHPLIGELSAQATLEEVTGPGRVLFSTWAAVSIAVPGGRLAITGGATSR